MSARFTAIRGAGAGRAYAAYVTGPVTAGRAAQPDVASGEIGRGDAAYAAYAIAGATHDGEAGRWLGRQAAAWGLAEREVDEAVLGVVLGHRDPTTGGDLDAERIRAAERWADRYAAWERARERWDRNPQLAQQAAALDRAHAVLTEGGARATDSQWVAGVLASELGPVLGHPQMAKIETAVMRAVADGHPAAGALRAQQGRMRLIPPAESMRREAPVEPTRDVVGFDLTFHAPKSISLLLTDDTTRTAVIACHDRAVERAVALLERELSAARAGKGGRERLAVTGLAVAAVNHLTARPAGDPPMADPSLHTHAVVSALVHSENGWSAVDSGTWYRATGLLGAVYEAELRAELTAELGVAWRHRETRDPVTNRASTQWEMMLTDDAARDDELIEAFSRRSAEIKAEVDAAREAGKRASADVAWAATRQEKDELPIGECIEEWRDRLTALGLTPELLAAQVRDRATSTDRRRADESRTAGPLLSRLANLPEAGQSVDAREIGSEAVVSAAEELAATYASFSRQDLLGWMLGRVPPHIAASETTAWVDQYLNRIGVVTQPAREHDPTGWLATRWTTEAHLQSELALLATIDRLRSPDGAAVSVEVAHDIQRAMAAGKGALTPEQTRLFLAALRDGDGGRLTACVAPAGAGKSYVASAIAEAWRQEHGATAAVVTVAPASRAGVALSDDLLQRRAEIDGSIDRLLVKLEHGSAAVDEQSLVAVDEAGMASNAKLQPLLDAVEKAGARVLLFGDPEQLDAPLSAGGVLKLMDTRGQTVRFDTTARTRDAATRDAQLSWREALATGQERKALEALDHYVDQGAIRVTDGPEAARDEAFRLWVAAFEDARERQATWEAEHAQLRIEAEAAVGSERIEIEERLDAHTKARPELVRDELFLLAGAHDDVAILSDRVQAYLTEHGHLYDQVAVEGRRWRQIESGDRELLVAADGTDLSETKLCRGLQVRVTANASSGEIQQRIDRIVRHHGGDFRAAYAASSEMRDLGAELRQSKVLNGQRAVIEHVHPGDGGATVRVTNGRGEDRLVRLTREQLMDGLIVPAAGGTMTVHASQGLTADHVIELDRPGVASGNSMYVGMTRARESAQLVFAGDRTKRDPRLAQWENDRRRAEREARPFDRPPPTERVEGLWQLAAIWGQSSTATMAVHEIERQDGGVVVTPDDRLAARRVLDGLGTTYSPEALEAKAVDLAIQRQAAMRGAAEAERARLDRLVEREALALRVG